MPIPKLEKNLAIVVALAGAAIVLTFRWLGGPVSLTGYVFIPLGLGGIAWGALSTLSPA